MPVVVKTDFVNKGFNVGKNDPVKILEIDGFRHNAVIVNSDTTNTVYAGGEAIKDELKTKGVPLFPGQSFSTNSLSALYCIAEDAVGTGSIDVRVMTEEELEGKSFTVPNMNGVS